MGANCSRCFIDKEEAEQWIREQVKCAFESSMNPVGDAVILDADTDTMHFYDVKITQDYDRRHEVLEPVEVGLKEKTSGVSVPNILGCVVGRYGEKPTKEKPFLAMVRFE